MFYVTVLCYVYVSAHVLCYRNFNWNIISWKWYQMRLNCGWKGYSDPDYRPQKKKKKKKKNVLKFISQKKQHAISSSWKDIFFQNFSFKTDVWFKSISSSSKSNLITICGAIPQNKFYMGNLTKNRFKAFQFQIALERTNNNSLTKEQIVNNSLWQIVNFIYTSRQLSAFTSPNISLKQLRNWDSLINAWDEIRAYN